MIGHQKQSTLKMQTLLKITLDNGNHTSQMNLWIMDQVQVKAVAAAAADVANNVDDDNVDDLLLNHAFLSSNS